MKHLAQHRSLSAHTIARDNFLGVAALASYLRLASSTTGWSALVRWLLQVTTLSDIKDLFKGGSRGCCFESFWALAVARRLRCFRCSSERCGVLYVVIN